MRRRNGQWRCRPALRIAALPPNVVAMRDDAILSELQRTRGVARLGLRGRDGRIVPDGLFQQGSARAILPKVPGAPEVVFLNTSGGLTGGDRLSYGLRLGEGVAACATTQTAERAYRSTGDVAEVSVRFDVGAGAWLDWLPQETILFDAARLHRRTETRMDEAARGCLALECVVLGRAAMGETVRRLEFRDRREIWQGEKRIFADPVSVEDATLGAEPAGLGGARAFASLVLVEEGAGEAVEPVRRMLDEPGVRAAVSALPGRLVLRALAVDGWPLRRMRARVLIHLRGRPLPRVWQM